MESVETKDQELISCIVGLRRQGSCLCFAGQTGDWLHQMRSNALAFAAFGKATTPSFVRIYDTADDGDIKNISYQFLYWKRSLVPKRQRFLMLYDKTYELLRASWVDLHDIKDLARSTWLKEFYEFLWWVQPHLRHIKSSCNVQFLPAQHLACYDTCQYQDLLGI